MSEDKKKLETLSVRLPTDVRSLLDRASVATGATLNRLIIEALRAELPNVVRKLTEQRRKAEEDFFSVGIAGAEDPAEDKKRGRRK